MLGERQKTRNLILVRFSENKVPVLGFVFMKGLGFFFYYLFVCFLMKMVNNLGNYVSPKTKNCLNTEVYATRKYN